MDDSAKEFILAYAALCKEHGLCIVPEAWEDDLYIADLNQYSDWVEILAVREGRETYKAYQKQVKDGH